MHLLNDSKSTHSPLLDLPPIQSFAFSGSGHSISLPPLDLDAGQRPVDKSKSSIASICAKPGDEGSSRPHSTFKDTSHHEDGVPRLVKKSSHSLRLLLDDDPPEIGAITNPTTNDQTGNSLRIGAILDENHDFSDDVNSKKRHRALVSKEELMHLPQPLKKQKSSQQVMPPIINGLHEPPPNAAVLPPISSAEFDEHDHLTLGILKEYGNTFFDLPASSASRQEVDRDDARESKDENDKDADNDQDSDKPKKPVKPRRKWSEQETKNLLLGVSRHGVGKWVKILEDPDFEFDDRGPGDLKDRFRTCCPDELRGKLGIKYTTSHQRRKKKQAAEGDKTVKSKSSLSFRGILIDSDEQDQDRLPPLAPSLTLPASQEDLKAMAAAKPKNSRAHRKKMEDLVELGISSPFKKSHRRERRHFTDEDDKKILEGLEHYGPAWTKIQRDPRFNLSNRQPTDLRDRVRNKYPDIYNCMERSSSAAAAASAKELIRSQSASGGLLEPAVSTTLESAFAPSSKSDPLHSTLNKSTSKENMPKWPSSLLLDPHDTTHHSFDLSEPSTTALQLSAGEMDISRLLLDDSQLSTDTT